ncbi:glutathione S-transferase [Aestuariirhabdus sp. LZHN29]|uniref:glutathione S-transferase n=1 Tax=Aestuariirhabdus sp. LZHN29 TaxID=3417462 RepID=UPI003CEB6F5E
MPIQRGKAMTVERPPILYSFRRCPYAMRARLALQVAGIRVELREVVLRNKPAQLVAISPKATVPVLQLSDGQVIEQSLAIMHWALSRHDPHQWLPAADREGDVATLIERNDGDFKHWLDRYKYADRFPERAAEAYRAEGERFLAELEARLTARVGLQGKSWGLADAAIFPFVRQFAHVDRNWFDTASYPRLRKWLDEGLATPLFAAIMVKYPPWKADDPPTLFGPEAR